MEKTYHCYLTLGEKNEKLLNFDQEEDSQRPNLPVPLSHSHFTRMPPKNHSHLTPVLPKTFSHLYLSHGIVLDPASISETASHMFALFNFPSLIVSFLAPDGSLTTTVFCVSKIDLSDVWKSLRER